MMLEMGKPLPASPTLNPTHGENVRYRSGNFSCAEACVTAFVQFAETRTDRACPDPQVKWDMYNNIWETETIFAAAHC